MAANDQLLAEIRALREEVRAAPQAPLPSPTNQVGTLRAFAALLEGGTTAAEVARQMKAMADHLEVGESTPRAWEKKTEVMDEAAKERAELRAAMAAMASSAKAMASAVRGGRGPRASGSGAGRGAAGRKCSRCGRTSHVASACFAKTHVDGKTLG
jgi:hypothetical protein